MEKLTVSIRIAPQTRESLVELRKDTGLPYGVLVDMLVDAYMTEKDGVSMFPTNLLTDRIKTNAYDFRKGLSGEAKNHILYTIVQEYDDKPFKEVINDESN